jgi:putative FmdB family regulatory protein
MPMSLSHLFFGRLASHFTHASGTIPNPAYNPRTMPIYEYACTACGERTEAKQGFDDPPLEECPICGGRLRKLYSPVGIVFKGTGFYATDAKKGAADKDEKPAKKSPEKASDGGGSGDKKKPAADTEKTA